MNVVEINPGTKGTLAHYFAAAFTMTIVTAWIIAFQRKYIFKEKATFKRLGWPVYLFVEMIKEKSMARPRRDTHTGANQPAAYMGGHQIRILRPTQYAVRI